MTSSSTISSSISSDGATSSCSSSISSNSIQWTKTIELGYITTSREETTTTTSATKNTIKNLLCFYCGKIIISSAAAAAAAKDDDDSNNHNDNKKNNHDNHNQKILRCSRCLVAAYCTKECQIKDWKLGSCSTTTISNNSMNSDCRNSSSSSMLIRHKLSCQSYKRVGIDMCIGTDIDKQYAKNEIFHRIRLYACSYAIYQSQTIGMKDCCFLFIQSNQTLAIMSLMKPQDTYGKYLSCSSSTSSDTNTNSSSTSRSVLIHYLTLAEYDHEICRDDFEMALVRDALYNAVQNIANNKNKKKSSSKNEDNNNNINDNADTINETSTTTTTLSSLRFEGKEDHNDVELRNDNDTDTDNDGHHPYYDIVLFMKFRCGHISIGTISLSKTDYNLCKTIGNQYYNNNINNNIGSKPIQLNID